MEIQTFQPRISAEKAIDRTIRITVSSFIRANLASFLGTDKTADGVYPVYYPDYIAYTTVNLHRYFRGDRTLKFLAGIDAITGRVGEVDVELPDRKMESIESRAAIQVELTETEVESAWYEWIFSYINRNYRPAKRPEFSLDDLELLYVPYWIVDFGSVKNSFAVSGLTQQVERIEAIPPIEGYYESMLSSAAND